MRLYGSGQTKPSPWDRATAGETMRSFVSAGVAPHAQTVRWTVTVPTDSQIRIQSAKASILQDSVATTAGIGNADVRAAPGGTGNAPVVEALTDVITLATYVSEASLGQFDLIAAGGIIEGITADLSVGGTKRYIVTALTYSYK